MSTRLWVRLRAMARTAHVVGPMPHGRGRNRTAARTTPARRALATLLFIPAIAAAVGSPRICEGNALRVVLDRREEIVGGRPFGAVGPYERLIGRIYFAFDPANPHNAQIVDLDRAPRNAAGLVEAWANFIVLRPKDPVKANGVALVEVSNRGRTLALSHFNRVDGGETDADTTSDFGDGFLMRHGFTVVWVGWQFDVPEGLPESEHLLRLRVPVVTDGGRTIEGLVRSDWTVDRVFRTLGLGDRSEIGFGHVGYAVAAPDDTINVLTVRDGRLSPRRVVPRSQWRFAREDSSGRVVDDPRHIYMPSGFQPGKIYELVYRGRDPVVVGLGLAAIRDVASYAKYDNSSLFPARIAIAFGVSQSGRFLRHFLYQGFNTDERGRQAFDGMLIHVAGAGRGSFNHRFAQPSRDARPWGGFFYPTDIFPFTSRAQHDRDTGINDGLLTHAASSMHAPKIFQINAGYEYWGRAASLIHTTVDGRADLEPPPNERIYHLASGQHVVGRFPPEASARLPGSVALRGNPLDFRFTLRALLAHMVEWVATGAPPPPSTYPRLASRTLVRPDRVRFPHIAGVLVPGVVHEAYRVDYGPRWGQGIIDLEPPRVGKPFPTLVPQVDSIGNELGGVRSVELLAPVATYTPWQLRTSSQGAPDQLVSFRGMFIPLPRTDAERRATGDPRPSLEALYGSKSAYLARATAAARALVVQRFLLEEDVAPVVMHAGTQWDWVVGR